MADSFPLGIAAELEATILGEKDGRAKSWVKVFPLGHTIVYGGKEITFSKPMLADMVAKFKADGVSLPVDYDHMSDPALVAPPEVKRAAGEILDIELRDDGMYAHVNWTAQAVAFIRAGEWTRISPEFAMNYTDKGTGKHVGPKLRAIALVNRPFLEKEMPKVAAKESETKTETQLTTDGLPNTGPIQRGHHMDKRVFELLKLTEGADPVPAVEALIASAADLTAKLAEANDARAKIEAVAKAGVDETAKLAERVKALEDEKRGAEVEAFIADLANKNLITPAQKDSVRALAVKELDAARAIFKDAKPVIALGAVGSDAKADVLPESPSLRFTELVRREMAKGKSYDAAEVAVLAENPGLFKAMNDERRPPADA